MGVSKQLICLLRNLHAGQEATAIAGHGTMDWFQIGKRGHQNSILSPCLFNLNAEYIMWNVKLIESQAGIKIARRIINNLRYADDSLMAGSKEEQRASWWRWKRRVKRLNVKLLRLNITFNVKMLKVSIQKTKIMASNPITSWQTGKKWKQWQILFSSSSESLWTVTATMKLNDACSLEEKLWKSLTAY